VGGALDLFAARVANLLVGNAEEAALLEITFGGLRLRFNDSRSVAWCGGTFQARIAEAKFPAGCRGIVRRGEELEFDPVEAGGRAWIAIAGGIDVPSVLGSRSTDLRSGFGGFEGRAWVRAREDAVMRLCGRSSGSPIAPMRFEVVRALVDGQYWFPVLIRADEAAPIGDDKVHVRVTVKYSNYKAR